jgi:hypothetical protein
MAANSMAANSVPHDEARVVLPTALDQADLGNGPACRGEEARSVGGYRERTPTWGLVIVRAHRSHSDASPARHAAEGPGHMPESGPVTFARNGSTGLSRLQVVVHGTANDLRLRQVLGPGVRLKLLAQLGREPDRDVPGRCGTQEGTAGRSADKSLCVEAGLGFPGGLLDQFVGDRTAGDREGWALRGRLPARSGPRTKTMEASSCNA